MIFHDIIIITPGIAVYACVCVCVAMIVQLQRVKYLWSLWSDCDQVDKFNLDDTGGEYSSGLLKLQVIQVHGRCYNHLFVWSRE